ncbi:MAG: ATP-binding protein [Kofleriaceae bacterium]
MIAELLRAVPLFHELADADLARIAAGARLETIAAGTCVIAEGSEPDAMYIVVDGELDVTKRGLPLNTCGPGDLIGELAVLEGRPRTASVIARGEVRLITLNIAALHELLRGSLTATLAILRTMASRLGNTESVVRQHDMLASLGRISAGLAHELNNPAAAVKRGAVELEQRLATWDPFALRGIVLDEAAVRRLIDAPRVAPPTETGLQRARRERTLEEALVARGIANAWELAPALAALHWDLAALDALAAAVPAPALATVLAWIETTTQARAVARDVAAASARISELVAAVRTHAHLGEAPVQEVDVHSGLDSTLTLLHHKMGAITVRRDYGELPAIDAYGSELNQVWTNLVDNAIAAMAGTGELAIVTRAAGDSISVEVIDDGPGIPETIQPEIWKPFFTTKPPGEGSGLGLHLSWNVVVRRHRGRIELESRPGRTCFRVVLPIRLH